MKALRSVLASAALLACVGSEVVGTDDPLAGARARGSATLEDCYRLAAELAAPIGRAQEELVRAEEARRRARSFMLPEVTLESVYTRQDTVDAGELGLPSSSPGAGPVTTSPITDRRREALVRLRQPIFGGFRELNAFAATGLALEARRLQLEDERRGLYGRVGLAFYLVLQRESAVEILRESVGVETERLREISARQEVGLARRTEVLLVQSQLSEDEARLEEARNEVDTARDLLELEVGGAIPLPLQDEPEEAASAEVSLEERIQVALARRADLRQLEKEVESLRRSLAVVKGQWSPSLDLDGSWYVDREGYSAFAEATDWVAEINLTMPLFEGGRIRAEVAASASLLREAEIDRDERARAIRIEVSNAWRTLRSDEARFRTLEVQVASAEESFRLVQEEYRAGLATNLEVLAAQNQWLAGRLELDAQRYRVRYDKVALLVAEGLLPDGGAKEDLE